MSITIACGTFVKESSDSDGADQYIDVGHQVKAIIVWCEEPVTSDAEGGGDSHFYFGFGIPDDFEASYGNGAANSFHVEDAQTTTDTHSMGTSAGSSMIRGYSMATNGEWLRGNIYTDPDGFYIDWQNSTGTATIIHYLAFSGDDIEAEIGTISPPTSTGTVSYTFANAAVKNISDGEGIIFFSGRNGSTSYADVNHFWGCAVSASKECSITLGSDNANSVSECYMGSDSNACIANSLGTSDAFDYVANFLGWDADGFDLNWSQAGGGNEDINYLVIKGGRWDCGMETSATSATTKSTTTAFLPIALFTVQSNRTSDGHAEQDVSFSIGAASAGITGHSAQHTEETGLSTTKAGYAGSTSKINRILTASADPPTVDGEAELDSFSVSDFTLDWTNAPSAAFQFLWVVAGDKNHTRTASETVTVSESPARVLGANRSDAEDVTVSESASRSGSTFVRTVSEAVNTISEMIATQSGKSRSASEAVTVSDSATRTGVFNRAISEVVTISESISRAGSAFIRAVTEGIITISEAIQSLYTPLSITRVVLEGDGYIQTVLSDDGVVDTILEGNGYLQTSLNDDGILY